MCILKDLYKDGRFVPFGLNYLSLSLDTKYGGSFNALKCDLFMLSIHIEIIDIYLYVQRLMWEEERCIVCYQWRSEKDKN